MTVETTTQHDIDAYDPTTHENTHVFYVDDLNFYEMNDDGQIKIVFQKKLNYENIERYILHLANHLIFHNNPDSGDTVRTIFTNNIEYIELAVNFIPSLATRKIRHISIQNINIKNDIHVTLIAGPFNAVSMGFNKDRTSPFVKPIEGPLLEGTGINTIEF